MTACKDYSGFQQFFDVWFSLSGKNEGRFHIQTVHLVCFYTEQHIPFLSFKSSSWNRYLWPILWKKKQENIFSDSLGHRLHTILGKEYYAGNAYVCICTQLYPALCYLKDCSPPGRLLCPWNFPGKDTGVGSHLLLQAGTFLKIFIWYWSITD